MFQNRSLLSGFWCNFIGNPIYLVSVSICSVCQPHKDRSLLITSTCVLTRNISLLMPRNCHTVVGLSVFVFACHIQHQQYVIFSPVSLFLSLKHFVLIYSKQCHYDFKITPHIPTTQGYQWWCRWVDEYLNWQHYLLCPRIISFVLSFNYSSHPIQRGKWSSCLPASF